MLHGFKIKSHESVRLLNFGFQRFDEASTLWVVVGITCRTIPLITYMTIPAVLTVDFRIPNDSTLLTTLGLLAKFRIKMVVKAVLIDKFLQTSITFFQKVIPRGTRVSGPTREQFRQRALHVAEWLWGLHTLSHTPNNMVAQRALPYSLHH
uniref:Uncharacterized protein n=1 Tax=Meloidogyne incognita TaxID=6306 RepID=A0A914NXH8_MELIC